MTAYYNEHDPFAAAWLRELIKAGHITQGEVDERSIVDITPADLAGFTQHHFFAGIGGWSYALRLAGWPDDKPVWTGSCPCQPFSAAGKGGGFVDERHLWPAWYHLIQQCSPDIIFGEQVEGAIKHGWLDLVQDDLEAIGYSVGAVCLPAASVGAPHLRQRLWIVADTTSKRLQGRAGARQQDTTQTSRLLPTGSSARSSLWADCTWLPCTDGKDRPVEPGTLPVAYGIPARVGRLRGYGNAVVPQVAAEVIRAYLAYAVGD